MCAFLAALSLFTNHAAAAGLPAAGPRASQEQDLLDLKSNLDAAEARQSQARSDLDRIAAQIQDANADITRTRVAVAEAESAVRVRRERITGLVKELYARPLTGLLTVLSAKSLNEYVVAQQYLERAVRRDAGALDDYEAARAEQNRLQGELVDKRRALEDVKRRRDKWQRILDGSVQQQQLLVADLERRLAQAKATNTLPWGTIANCAEAPRTGVPDPQNLEDWAVWTLKSLAMRTGRQPQDTVTREHIVALVAFAWGEGGAIQGHRGQYNPLNTNGWWRLFPELGGRASGMGTDDWPTFDAGVEASARAITAKTQSRLGSVLVNPSSTAADFFGALASPEAYPGNKNWSANDKLHVGKYASLTSRVNSGYTKYAGEPLRAAGQVLTGIPRPPTGQSLPGSLQAALAC